jgi:hypothetical protein
MQRVAMMSLIQSWDTSGLAYPANNRNPTPPLCNGAMAAFPWYQSKLQTYIAQIIHSMPLLPGQSHPPVTYSSTLLLFSASIGLILYGVAFWLLHRHRAAFKTPPLLEA